MGLYLNTIKGKPLPALGKASAILGMAPGAVCIGRNTMGGTPIQWNEEIVCIVDNGSFEAAAWAFSPEELEDFNQKSDHRLRDWLIVPNLREYIEETNKPQTVKNYLGEKE